jgi:hypothetical protein
MRLYTIIDSIWTDPFGSKHRVDQVVGFMDVEKAGFFPHHNGYHEDSCRVYVDLSSKRSILAIPPMDFGASTHYSCTPSLPKGTRLVGSLNKKTIGLDGNIYLKDDPVETLKVAYENAAIAAGQAFMASFEATKASRSASETYQAAGKAYQVAYDAVKEKTK